MEEDTKLEKKRAINRAYMRRWREKNPELSKERGKLQALNLTNEQCQSRRAYGHIWRLENRQKTNEYQKVYQVQYRKDNANARIRHNLRNRLWGALRVQNARKDGNVEKLIGCSISKLKSYLEGQFIKGMGWGKGIHIDHKIPLISFDLTKSEEQARAFHYSNLQPLWARDNLVKGSKIYV